MTDPRRAGALWLIGAVLALLSWQVRAQTIDEVRLQPQGADMVARITFNATVRLMQFSPTTPASLYRLSFDLITGD